MTSFKDGSTKSSEIINDHFQGSDIKNTKCLNQCQIHWKVDQFRLLYKEHTIIVKNVRGQW